MSRDREPIQVSPIPFSETIFLSKRREGPPRSAVRLILREILRVVRHLDLRNRPPA